VVAAAALVGTLWEARVDMVVTQFLVVVDQVDRLAVLVERLQLIVAVAVVHVDLLLVALPVVVAQVERQLF
jgi:hypothetical protein